MKQRPNLLLKSLLAVLWTYAVLGGVTSGGLLTPQYTFMTLIFTALLIAGWLVIRWRRGWSWFHTPLDGAFILWGAAILISTLANLDVWARIAIGLWFALAYCGLWYVLHDSIANRGLDRNALQEGILIGGAVAMLFGYLQLVALVASGSIKTLAALLAFRPRGTLDNPNSLAALMVMVVPLAISGLLTTRSRVTRVVLTVYLLLALILVGLTFSRGGWIGMIAALLALAVLWLAHHDLLSFPRLMGWWRSQAKPRRMALGGAAAFVVVACVVVGLLFIRSFTTSGREVDLRTYIYDAAIRIGTEKPLTGYGLFTFGRHLMRFASTPPYVPHAHAHNIPLNVTAELGITGLLALAVSAWFCLRAMRRNWWALTGQPRLLLIGAVAAVVGTSVHQLLDSPGTTTPLIAVAGVCVLVLATAPVNPLPAPSWQRRVQPVLLAGLWAILLIAGWRTTTIYQDYVTVLQSGSQDGDYRSVAQRLQPVIDAAPTMPVYHLYQAYFLGVAADAGDKDAARQAIEAYRRFCALEPYYAPAWANLGSLYWQIGEREQALNAMERAVHFAPQAWMLQFNLGMYYETTGNTDSARRAYQATLKLYPDASLFPEWQQTDLRQQIARASTDKLTVLGQTVLLLTAGKFDEAAQLRQLPAVDPYYTTTQAVINEIMALGKGDRQTAENQLAALDKREPDRQIQAWIHLGMARLAHFDGDEAAARREVETARTLLASSTAALDERIPAIAFNQFWKIGLPQYFLPQVYAPPADAPLIRLLGARVP